jgi:hypothetical protein
MTFKLKFLALCLVALASMGLISPVHAQDQEAEDYESWSSDSDERSYIFRLLWEADDLGMDLEEPETDLEKSLAGYVSDLVARKREAIAEARRVFWWQRLASQVSFVLSHLFVLVALAAAMAEFLQARRLRSAGVAAETTELKVGMEGVAVKTSLAGFLLLASALGFYFLYLKFVYPIQFV